MQDQDCLSMLGSINESIIFSQQQNLTIYTQKVLGMILNRSQLRFLQEAQVFKYELF